MTSFKLKLYYDTDIATVKYNGSFPFENGQEYSFDNTSYIKLFKYQLKDQNAKLPNGNMFFYWGDNTYFVFKNMSGVNTYEFSESEIAGAYNNLAGNGKINPFLCLTSARYTVNGKANTKRPLIVCSNFASKSVVNNGDTDTITVTFDNYLTSVKLYYRNSSGGQYQDYNQGISADKHTFTATVPHINIGDDSTTTNDYSYIVVPTLTDQAPKPPANSTNITLQYNNGSENKTIDFLNQTAGTITGKVNAADGYAITGITEAYYQDRYGYKNTLKNLVVTKVTEQDYNFSVDLTDNDITFFKNNTTKKLMLTVNTSYTAGVDLILTYNDGLTTQIISYPKQTAGTITGKVHAADGYKITKVTKAYYHDRYNSKDFGNFIASKNSNTEYSFSFDVTSTDLAYIKKNSNVVTEILVFTENTSISANIDVKYNDGVNTQTLPYTSIKAGQKITGEINAASGYTITSVTGAQYAEEYGYRIDVTNFVATKISSYKYNFSFELTDTDIKRFAENPNYFVTVTVNTNKEIGNINIDTSGLINCSISPSTIIQDTKTQITLSADLGYILDGNGTYTVDGTSNNFTCKNASSYSFTVTADKTVVVAFTATKVETKSASISHTYVLDENGYNLLGKQYVQGVNSSGDGFSQYDYSKFINYLYEIPFAVTESITKPAAAISIGKASLDVACQYVTHETLTIDLGSIELPTKDSTDYKVNEVLLYVPFCENIELPFSVLGSTINIAMQINLLNESATLIVTQDNTVIVTRGTEIFTDLPLYFTAGTKDILVKTFKTQYQNTVKQAYISIAYNKPITNLTSYTTNEHGVLSEYKGFTRVTRGTLKNSINEEIDSLIIDRLQQGVIIK